MGSLCPRKAPNPPTCCQPINIGEPTQPQFNNDFQQIHSQFNSAPPSQPQVGRQYFLILKYYET